MARPEFGIKHVPDSVLLPKNLTRGRIYFIEDEGILKVNHGSTTATYGDRAGPQGPPGPPGPPGKPLPDLFERIDFLQDAVLKLEELISRLWLRDRDLPARILALENALANNQSDYDDFNQIIDDVFNGNIDGSGIPYDDVVKMIDDIFSDIDIHGGDSNMTLSDIIDRIDSLEEELNSLRNSSGGTDADRIEELSDDIDELRNTIENNESNNADLEDLQDQLQDISGQVEEIRDIAETNQEDISELRETVDSFFDV